MKRDLIALNGFSAPQRRFDAPAFVLAAGGLSLIVGVQLWAILPYAAALLLLVR